VVGSRNCGWQPELWLAAGTGCCHGGWKATYIDLFERLIGGAPDRGPVIIHEVTYGDIWQTEQHVVSCLLCAWPQQGAGEPSPKGGEREEEAREYCSPQPLQNTTPQSNAPQCEHTLLSRARGAGATRAWEGGGGEEKGGAVAAGLGSGWGRGGLEGPGGTA
jgi:hypothetical protein